MAVLLVTGASGFLGSRVCAAAAASGWTVHGTHLTTAPDAPGEHHRVDLRSFADLGALLTTLRPEAIVHTAYRQDDPEPWPLNLAASARLAGAAAGLGARLVHLSTDLVFSGRLGRPLREDDAPDPVDPYGAGKARAEAMVLARHPAATVVRTSLLLGGSRHEQLVLQAARGERDVTFFDDEQRSPCDAGDLAAAIVELLGRDDAAGPLHVAGPDVVTRHELARLVCARHGLDPDAVRGGPGPPERPKACALDVSRARALLATPVRGAHALLSG